MRKTMRFAAAVIAAVFALTGVTAFAQSNEPTETTTETVIEDSRTLTPKGNAELVDNVSDNENLQFITVTARDGNVFYFVIDHAAESENVYFLNTVDESDLAALVEDGKITEQEKQPTATETVNETSETEKSETPVAEKEQSEQVPQNNNMLLIIILLVCGGGVVFYYFKVVMPKKKLEQADDIDDFEFDDEDETDEPDELDEDEIEDYAPEEEYTDDDSLEDSIVYADDEEETE